jgi:hypothetical protein
VLAAGDFGFTLMYNQDGVYFMVAETFLKLRSLKIDAKDKGPFVTGFFKSSNVYKMRLILKRSKL